MAHTTPDGWPLLADPQLWLNYANRSRLHFAPEIEVGRMINKTTGIWLRRGSHLAGDGRRRLEHQRRFPLHLILTASSNTKSQAKIP